MRTLPFDTLRTVLQTQLRSGDGPDVFSYGSGPSFGGALVEAGLVQDLTEAYEERDWQVYDFAKERVTVDGKTYGVPGELETIGLFYNKDVFTELGLEEPQSVDELRAAADAIKASGRTPFAVGDKEGWEGGHLLSMALSSAIGSEGMEELFAGDRSWDSPEVVAALRLWKEFDEAGYLPQSPTSVDYDTSIAQFFSGDAAMMPTGSWLVGEIDDNADFEVGYIPFPARTGPGSSPAAWAPARTSRRARTTPKWPSSSSTSSPRRSTGSGPWRTCTRSHRRRSSSTRSRSHRCSRRCSRTPRR